MRFAVTGITGQLGSELCRQWGEKALPLDREQFPLTGAEEQLAHALDRANPDALIHPAAYTLVDQAEREPELCRAINADAVGKLARLCRERGIPLIHISTDYVFGAADTPHVPRIESDPVHAQGVYAQTKLEGERQAALAPRHIIVRTCGLYGQPGRPEARPHFVATMLRLARAGKSLKVVNDQHCTPSYVPDVARAIRFLTEGAIAGKATAGVYHVTNRGATTWHDFAAEIFRLKGLDVSLTPISTAEYAAPAPRPRYSVLDTAKYHSLAGPEMPTWQAALAAYLDTIP